MKNYKGFTVFEGLLALVIIGIIGATGWYVWHVKQQTNIVYDSAQSSTAKSSSKTSNKTKTVTDPTADWTTFTSSTNDFTVKYPKNWYTGGSEADCLGLLYLGPTQASAGQCSKPTLGEIIIYSQDGNQVTDSELTPVSDFTDYQKTNITVGGVSGLKESGVTNKDITSGTLTIAKGTKVIAYLFFTNNKTYLPTYMQVPGQPDVSSDFNTMVTKTLKFSS